MQQTPVIVFERGPKAIITLIVVVFVLNACFASSDASVLNNINNMLRDVPKKLKPLAIINASTVSSGPHVTGVRLLSKQLNVLMTRRREDYELLERNLLKSLRITMENERKQNSIATKINANNVKNSANNDWDLTKQLEQLRQEVQSLQTKHLGGNNERLTIEWLQQSVGELRKQLVELQQIASNAMRDVTTRTQSWEDLATIRSDFQQLKLELATLKERQQQTEVFLQELREETQQQEEDFRHLLQNKHHQQPEQLKQQQINAINESQDSKGRSSSNTEETMDDEFANIQVSCVVLCWLKTSVNF
uniref:Uncharacterized protein n=1 Tax=Glossina brevipalpis TaxID=37001 RepID=A0A1A9WDX3_9MUSC